MTDPTQPMPTGQMPPRTPFPPFSTVQTPEPPRKPFGWRMAKYGAAGLAGLVLGIAGSGGPRTDATPAPSVAPATVTVKGSTVTKTVAPVAPAVESTKVVTKTEAPRKAFGDGAWLVGRDIPAGKYTTLKEVAGSCYWERHNPEKTGIAAIVANGNVEGGHPTVIVKIGEEFRSMGCGEWRAA